MPHEFHVQLVSAFIFAQLVSTAWTWGLVFWSKSEIVTATAAADGNGKRLVARKAVLYFTIPCAAQGQRQTEKQSKSSKQAVLKF